MSDTNDDKPKAIKHDWNLMEVVASGAASALRGDDIPEEVKAAAQHFADTLDADAADRFDAFASSVDAPAGVDERVVVMAALASFVGTAAKKCLGTLGLAAGVYISDMQKGPQEMQTHGPGKVVIGDSGFMLCGAPNASATKARLSIILASGVFAAGIVPPAGIIASQAIANGMPPDLRLHFGRRALMGARDWAAGQPTVSEIADLLYGSRDEMHQAVRQNGGWKKIRETLSADIAESTKGFEERVTEALNKAEKKPTEEELSVLREHVDYCKKLSENVHKAPIDVRDVPMDAVPAEKLGSYLREVSALDNADGMAEEFAFLDKTKAAPEGGSDSTKTTEGGAHE